MKRWFLFLSVTFLQFFAFSQVRKLDSIQVVKRKSYYKGHVVNKMTRKGFKDGRWIILYDDNRLKSEEFYSGKDFHWDSAYFYYETTGKIERRLYHVKKSDSAVMKREYNDQATPTRTFLWNGDTINEPEYRTFYSSGSVRSEVYPYPNKYQLDYFASGEIHKYTSYTYEGKKDSIKHFYETGALEKLELLDSREKPSRVFIYDKEGDLISYQHVYRRTRIDWKYLHKSDSLCVVENYYNSKLRWTDRGTYKEGELWNGIRTSSQEGAHPRVFVNGKENGIQYQGEWVNRSDSLRQQGPWYQFHHSHGPVREISHYKNGVLDSLFRYYESGALETVQYSRGTFSSERRKIKRFSENAEVLFEEGGFEGDTVWVSYLPTGEVFKMKKRNGWEYKFEKGDACSYTVKRKKSASSSRADELLGMNEYLPKRYGPSFDFYKKCKMYKRITSKYHVLPYDAEGRENVRNSYSIEKGVFVDDKFHNGVREYYDAEDKRIRSVRVVNGKEI